MKMKSMRFIAVITAGILGVTLMGGCASKEKEEKKKKKKEGPSWFEKTFNKISNEIFSDDDLK